MVDVRAAIDVEGMHRSGGLVNPVDDPVGAAQSTMAAGERSEELLADTVRIDGECGVAEFQNGGCDGFRESAGDSTAGCRLEPDFVPLLRFCSHTPVARRLARSWRTAARSAPGSPRPSADRLSEIRATESVSARISCVISRPSRLSTSSKTASASPLRVSVIRSCCWRTRLASSDRLRLDQVGQFSDHPELGHVSGC